MRRKTLAVAGAVALVVLVLSGSASAATLNWSSPKPIDSQAVYMNHLEGAACPSASFCVLGDNSGHVLTSTEPAAEAWSAPAATGGGFADLSCPSASFCAGVGGGKVNISTDPSGGGTAWTATEIDPSYPELSGIACASSSLCVAVDLAGHILSSTDPTGGAGAWNMAGPIDNIGRLYGVSCPTTSFCAAVGVSGTVFTSTNPSGGAGAWMATVAEPMEGELFGIDCSSASFCVAAGDGGAIVSSTNPTGGSAAWSAVNLSIEGGVGQVSCPSSSFCAVANFKGNVATSTEPAGGPGAWAITNVDGETGVVSMACPSSSLCVAGDDAGAAITGSTEPKAQHVLTIARSGSGNGSVSSSPGGIACGSICAHSFNAGTPIVLTATPQAGSIFLGWSGGPCAGTGICQFTLADDATVTAAFGIETSSGDIPASSPSPTAPSTTPPLLITSKPKPKKLVCRKGFKKQKIRGKQKCIKVKKKHRR